MELFEFLFGRGEGPETMAKVLQELGARHYDRIRSLISHSILERWSCGTNSVRNLFDRKPMPEYMDHSAVHIRPPSTSFVSDILTAWIEGKQAM